MFWVNTTVSNPGRQSSTMLLEFCPMGAANQLVTDMINMSRSVLFRLVISSLLYHIHLICVGGVLDNPVRQSLVLAFVLSLAL